MKTTTIETGKCAGQIFGDRSIKCPWCCGDGVNVYEVTSIGVLYSEPCACDHNGLISEKCLKEKNADESLEGVEFDDVE